MPRKQSRPPSEAKITFYVRLKPEVAIETRVQAAQADLTLNDYVQEALVEHNKRQSRKAARQESQLELVR